jgi:hypothetical protein
MRSSRTIVPTVVVRTSERSLYYVLGNGQAIRYTVGVVPPAEIKHDKPYLPDVIPGGSGRNPMGAAALTLSQGEYAIHGTITHRKSPRAELGRTARISLGIQGVDFCVPADFAPPNFPAWKIRRLKIREESLGGLVQKPHEIAAITAHRRATPPAVAGSRPAIRREGVASVVLAFVPHAPLTESELMLPVHERRRGAGSRPVEWLSICGGSVSAAILRRM